MPPTGSVFASEQNINESIVTPSGEVLVPDANCVDGALPYEERVLVGTELADEVNATAKIAAKPKITLSFFMKPPALKDRTTPRSRWHVGFQFGDFVRSKQIF